MRPPQIGVNAGLGRLQVPTGSRLQHPNASATLAIADARCWAIICVGNGPCLPPPSGKYTTYRAQTIHEPNVRARRIRRGCDVYSLKRLAKDLSRERKIPLHAALNRIAQEEGFASWSLLAARLSAESPARELLSQLGPGDLLLLGARPSHGKTLLGLELAVKTVQSGGCGWFFTLEWNTSDLLNGLRVLGEDPSAIGDRFGFDNSNAICASYIIDRLATVESGTVVVIDYLQLLDQKRENPELVAQVQSLKAFARDREIIVVFISQIDRSYDPLARPIPGLADVRLPNPLDLSLFYWTCFLNNGAIQVSAVN